MVTPIYESEEAVTRFLTFCQFITHIQQKPDLFILYGSIQCYGDPMSLIHMLAGKDARFQAKCPDQFVAFEIDHADLTISVHSRLFSGNVHENGKIFLASGMPEHLEIRIPGKKIFAGGVVGVC